MHSLTLSLAMKQKWMQEGNTPMLQQCSCHFSLVLLICKAVSHTLQLYHTATFQHQDAIAYVWFQQH